LTAADSALLKLMAEEAIATGILHVSWPDVVTRAASQGMEEALATESLAVLEQRHYAEREPLCAGGAILMVELSPRGFRKVVDTIVSGAETARQHIIASLVNAPPDSNTVIDDLATLTGAPRLFVFEFLRELQAQGHLTLIRSVSGNSVVAGISPALKRLLE
jgi:hypothetical protein